MQGEQGVVGLGGDQMLEGGELHEAHQDADAHAHEEEGHHGVEVEQADALVVCGGEPGQHAFAGAGVHQVAGCVHACSLPLPLPLCQRPFRTSTSTKTTAPKMMIMAAVRVVLNTYFRPTGS